MWLVARFNDLLGKTTAFVRDEPPVDGAPAIANENAQTATKPDPMLDYLMSSDHPELVRYCRQKGWKAGSPS